jgi:hypothetical protein
MIVQQHAADRTVGDDIAAKIEQIKLDVPAFQFGDDITGVERAAKSAVELGGDDDIARLHAVQQRLALRALGERH